MVQKIFKRDNFTDKSSNSAYDLLCSIKDELKGITGGVLELEIEAIDSFLDVEPPKPIALYIVYVKVPALSNYRKKIISVIEGKETGRFPVQLYSHLDNFNEPTVSEEEFLKKISEIMQRTAVDSALVTLYRQASAQLDNARQSGPVQG